MVPFTSSHWEPPLLGWWEAAAPQAHPRARHRHALRAAGTAPAAEEATALSGRRLRLHHEGWPPLHPQASRPLGAALPWGRCKDTNQSRFPRKARLRHSRLAVGRASQCAHTGVPRDPHASATPPAASRRARGLQPRYGQAGGGVLEPCGPDANEVTPPCTHQQGPQKPGTAVRGVCTQRRPSRCSEAPPVPWTESARILLTSPRCQTALGPQWVGPGERAGPQAPPHEDGEGRRST